MVNVNDVEAENADQLAMLLVQANYDSYVKTENWLIETLKERAERAEATIALIQHNINWLCHQPYTPNPLEILKVLYPWDEEIDEFIAHGGKHREGPF